MNIDDKIYKYQRTWSRRTVLICLAMIAGLFSFIGKAQAATLTLTWDVSSDPDLAGYNIYYATSSLVGLSSSTASKLPYITKSYISLANLKTQLNFYAINGLSTNATYYMRITAQD